MRVIGTAGHVDHGKSTLVKRLTGIDPDRLAEEKKREMTIDLGFAWLTLPDGETVGIVDVPGHRDFIENMLAGVGGIDAVLLVIAADEGVMPQTREHLAILDLLNLERGLVVLTKIDMVNDPEWRALVVEEIRETLAVTALADAEIIPVSAYTGEGIETLIERLTALLSDLPMRPDLGRPRLPVDRVFTMSGFGTVVTGTLTGGSLHVGDEITLLPSGQRGRIRGLQSYKQSVETASPGSRVAVNITGIARVDILRGHVLGRPGQLQPTQLIDVYFRHLLDASRPLKHNSQVKFFSGTAEAVGHVRLLNDDVIAPGAEGWLQIRLAAPLGLDRGDRFILRYPSPSETIGGGVIVDAQPARRWKRFNPAVITRLETQREGTPAERLAQAAEGSEAFSGEQLRRAVSFSPVEFDVALNEALASGLLVDLDRYYLARASYQQLQQQITTQLNTFHTNQPLRLNMPREELRSRTGLRGAILTLLVAARDDLIIDGDGLRLSSHSVTFTAAQQRRVDEFRDLLAQAPYTPPSYAEAVENLGEAVLHALIESGELAFIAPDIVLPQASYAAMTQTALHMIDNQGDVDVKGLRDHFGTSRKYAIALLEHLDTIGITKRVGDVRVRGPRAKK
jgi:selenocysteine-specific elongation factor